MSTYKDYTVGNVSVTPITELENETNDKFVIATQDIKLRKTYKIDSDNSIRKVYITEATDEVKEQIARAISAKGVPTSSTADWETIVANILSIPTSSGEDKDTIINQVGVVTENPKYNGTITSYDSVVVTEKVGE